LASSHVWSPAFRRFISVVPPSRLKAELRTK
jgi:hypothetical protein